MNSPRAAHERTVIIRSVNGQDLGVDDSLFNHYPHLRSHFSPFGGQPILFGVTDHGAQTLLVQLMTRCRDQHITNPRCTGLQCNCSRETLQKLLETTIAGVPDAQKRVADMSDQALQWGLDELHELCTNYLSRKSNDSSGATAVGSEIADAAASSVCADRAIQPSNTSLSATSGEQLTDEQYIAYLATQINAGSNLQAEKRMVSDLATLVAHDKFIALFEGRNPEEIPALTEFLCDSFCLTQPYQLQKPVMSVRELPNRMIELTDELALNRWKPLCIDPYFTYQNTLSLQSLGWNSAEVEWAKPMFGNRIVVGKYNRYYPLPVLRIHVTRTGQEFLVIIPGNAPIIEALELGNNCFAVRTDSQIFVYDFSDLTKLPRLLRKNYYVDGKIVSCDVLPGTAHCVAGLEDGRVVVCNSLEVCPISSVISEQPIVGVFGISENKFAVIKRKKEKSVIQVIEIAESPGVLSSATIGTVRVNNPVNRVWMTKDYTLIICCDDGLLWQKSRDPVMAPFLEGYSFVSALPNNRIVVKNEAEVKIYDINERDFMQLAKPIDAKTFLAIVHGNCLISQDFPLLNAAILPELVTLPELLRMYKPENIKPTDGNLASISTPKTTVQRLQEFAANHPVVSLGGISGVAVFTAGLIHYLRK